MNISIEIAGVDKSAVIDWPSFSIEDNVDEQSNLCVFKIQKHTGQTYSPTVGEEVEVFDDSEKIFGGKILSITNSIEGDIANYSIVCKDYTADLDRLLVTDSFTGTTVGAIIEYIIDNYTTGITYANVACTVAVTKIVFNKMQISKCFSELASLVNYNWYIDYEKDVHFFAKNSEASPFNITNTSTDIIADSLQLENDLSQLRNVVIIRGGDKVATNTRDKTHTGDGVQKTFNTDYQFASLPTVTVNGVAQTVGVENLDSEDDFDCIWDYNQKYVRFKTAPADTLPIVLTGNPLIPIIAQVEDLASVSTYGRFEFAKTDKTIKSSEEAKLYGEAQLNAYGKSIREGGFRTYSSGLKSGQTITITLSEIGVADSFIIQRVTLSMVTRTMGEWQVELATLKTIGIIKFLQDKLLNDNKKVDYNEDDLLEKYYMDNTSTEVTEEIDLLDKKEDYQNVEITEDIEKDPFGAGVAPDFVFTPYTPTGQTDPKREGIFGRSYWG